MASTRILVVDDEKLVRNFVSQVFRREGHQVVVACSAEEGLDLFEAQAFDVVVTDVKMDGMDGITMLGEMCDRDATLVPVVMTALRDQETAVRALEQGVQHFLIKPFTYTELRERLDLALAERERIVEDRLMIGGLIETRSNLRRQLLEQGKKLSFTERYLHDLIDAAPFGVFSADHGGCILTFNDEAERMYGYARQDVLGQAIALLIGDEVGTVEEGYATHRRKNGEAFPVVVHIRDVFNDAGQEIARLYILEDQSERELLESQLFRAERLSLLGQMAPRIAHEFKTPLQLVSGNAELARVWIDQGNIDMARVSIDRILPASEQLLYLVKQMTNLGKPEKKRREPLDMVAEVETVLDTLQPLGVVKYCTVERDYDSDLPPVFGDPAQLEQVLRNLIVNAAQAVEEASEKVLTVSIKQHESGVVHLKVADTGHGIAEAHLEEIFQPFYTTKPEGKGTGLGLAIVRSILRRHGASVGVESCEGKSTAFTLVFPAHITQKDKLCEDECAISSAEE